MDLSDNDFQRIVDRLRPTLSQILQNVGNSQSGNQSARISIQCTTPERGTTQSSPAQTGQTSPATTKAAALSQLFRRPSYVQRHRYVTSYQRYDRRSTATAASSRPGGGGGVLGSIFAGYVPLASPNPYPIIVYSVANYRPHLIFKFRSQERISMRADC